MIGSASDRPLRIAIVGCGWVAGTQMDEGFDRLPGLFEIVAACDLDPARAASFAGSRGIARHTPAFEEILAMEDVDAVSICTPPSEHYGMVRAAMEAGKHVICEKPFTSSLALMDEVIAAQARSRARVMPIFQYRFAPGFAKARHLIRSGLAGKLYTSSVETAWKRGPDYYAVPWRGKFATELGGVLLTQSIHIHDLFLSLAGPVAHVAGFKTTRVNPIEVEDCAAAALVMQDGSVATLLATLGSAEPTTRIRLCFENLTIERQCYGLEAPRPALEPWTVRPMRPELAPDIEATLAEVAPGDLFFAGQFRGFRDAIVSGGDFPVTLQEARRSLELITALFHASEEKVVVDLPIGSDHPRYNGWRSGMIDGCTDRRNPV
jgi:predicted dehydrogenase